MNVCGSFSFFNFFLWVDLLIYFPESLLFNGQSCKIVSLRWKIMKSKSFVVKHFYSCCLSCKPGSEMDFGWHPVRTRTRTSWTWTSPCYHTLQGPGQGQGGLVLHKEEAKDLDLCCKARTKYVDDSSLSSLSAYKEEAKDKDDSGLSSACFSWESCVPRRHKCLVLI